MAHRHRRAPVDVGVVVVVVAGCRRVSVQISINRPPGMRLHTCMHTSCEWECECQRVCVRNERMCVCV